MTIISLSSSHIWSGICAAFEMNKNGKARLGADNDFLDVFIEGGAIVGFATSVFQNVTDRLKFSLTLRSQKIPHDVPNYNAYEFFDSQEAKEVFAEMSGYMLVSAMQLLDLKADSVQAQWFDNVECDRNCFATYKLTKESLQGLISKEDRRLESALSHLGLDSYRIVESDISLSDTGREFIESHSVPETDGEFVLLTGAHLNSSVSVLEAWEKSTGIVLSDIVRGLSSLINSDLIRVIGDGVTLSVRAPQLDIEPTPLPITPLPQPEPPSPAQTLKEEIMSANTDDMLSQIDMFMSKIKSTITQLEKEEEELERRKEECENKIASIRQEQEALEKTKLETRKQRLALQSKMRDVAI